MPRGQNTDYMAALGHDRCLGLVQWRLQFVFPDNHVDTALRGVSGYRLNEDTHCWLWVGRTLPEGYAQIKRNTNAQLARPGGAGRNNGVNFLMHRIAYVSKHNRDVQHSASHLCGNPGCFNPDHIADETIELNNRRKGCIGLLKCPQHGEVIADLCDHHPKCIKEQPSPEKIRCCLMSQPTQLNFNSTPSLPPSNRIEDLSSTRPGSSQPRPEVISLISSSPQRNLDSESSPVRPPNWRRVLRRTPSMTALLNVEIAQQPEDVIEDDLGEESGS